MCGIAGLFNSEISPEDLCARVGEMTLAMAHRGPDDSGICQVAAGGSMGALGHRRLSILDLSPAGHQPMSRGRWTVVYNGEIYNSPALRKELTAAGCDFDSACDTETLCWALDTWGIEKTLDRINGMFAFAAVNGEELLLARDRLGIKPLYYWKGNSAFAFASELQALRKVPGFSNTVNHEALEHYLTLGYIPAPFSIHPDCRKLGPGEWLHWRGGGALTSRYWEPDLADTGSADGTAGEAGEHLEELLLDAVQARMLSDVPLGAFLSGGIDSSLVCALAQSQMNTPLRTFTIGFDFGEYDESKHAEAIARHLRTDHTTEIMTAKQLLDTVPKIPEIYAEPFGDPSSLPTYLLCQIARREVTVALSGDGGDELFFGYDRYRNFQAIKKYEKLPAWLRRFGGTLCQQLCGEGSALGKRGKAIAYQSLDEAFLYYAGIFHRLYFDRLTGHAFDLKNSPVHSRFCDLQKAGLDFDRLSPLLDQDFYLPEDILTKVDRASMAHSLEVRVPILDHRVAAAANRLPHYLKDQNGNQKHFLKQLLTKYVPAKLWNRPKQGFGAPLNHWFKVELRDLLEDYLAEDRLRQQGVFDSQFVRHLIDSHISDAKDNQYYLWNLLQFQMWLEHTGATV